MTRVRIPVLQAVAAGFLTLAFLGVATSASAHNVLISTNPADGTTVASLPATVVLTFDRPALALGSALRIVGPGGNVAQGPPSLVDTNVTETVAPGAPPGAYTVQWRVTSADGHPVTGQFRFTARAGDGGTAPPPTVAAGTTTAGTSRGSSSGGVPAVIWILAAAAAVVAAVVLAGVVLTTRREGRSRPPGQ